MQRKPLAGLVTFFCIAFGIPWAGWILLDNPDLNLWLFPSFCSIAGFAAAYAEGGASGFREFCRRTLRVKGAGWYILLAALIPLMLGLSYLLGIGTPLSAFDPSLEAFLGLTLLAAFFTGPLQEEFGWRGYLQGRLLASMRPVWAALVLAAIWCLWHLPLFYSSVFASPQSALRFLAYLTTYSIFMLYLVQSASGSVWPAVCFHWLANTHANILSVMFPSVDGSQLPGGSKTTVLYLLVAVIFAAVYWRFFAGTHKASAKAAVALP